MFHSQGFYCTVLIKSVPESCSVLIAGLCAIVDLSCVSVIMLKLVLYLVLSVQQSLF